MSRGVTNPMLMLTAVGDDNGLDVKVGAGPLDVTILMRAGAEYRDVLRPGYCPLLFQYESGLEGDEDVLASLIGIPTEELAGDGGLDVD